MKQDKCVFFIFLTLLTSSSSHAKSPSIKINNDEQLNIITEYLLSLDQNTRTRLASKLYYLDPLTKKQEAQSTLLEELEKGGRVINDANLSTGPKTISCESSGM